MHVRAFLALEITDESVLDSMVAAQNALAETGADLKIVERQNLHFTVKFLGEISDSQAKEVDSRLRKLTLRGANVQVKGIGAFPNAGSPNVIWVGVAHEDEGRVLPIAQPVIAALEGIGKEDNRPYRPHATLARVRSSRNIRSLAEAIHSCEDTVFGNTSISALKLKSSALSPSGPVYTDLQEYHLQ